VPPYTRRIASFSQISGLGRLGPSSECSVACEGLRRRPFVFALPLPPPPPTRGLHSIIFQLNLSAVYGTGGPRRDCVARVEGVLGVIHGV